MGGLGVNDQYHLSGYLFQQSEGIGSLATEPEPADLEDDVSFSDFCFLEGKFESVCSFFNSKKPNLDTLQEYLVERLASGDLQNEFEVSPNTLIIFVPCSDCFRWLVHVKFG